MPPLFSLQTFGGLALSGREGRGPLLAGQRKRLALVATLATDANGGVSRDRLLALFWPESDGERARNALNQIVFAIRRELGDDAILSDNTSLRLNSAVVESDVGRFRQAMSTGRFTEAIAEYRGPFLDGVFLRETPEFERWVSDTRQSIAADYARALEHEIEAAATASPPRLNDAVRYAQALVAHDLLSTQAVLQLMRILERAGDTAGALRHAAVHAAYIRAELQTEPGPLLDREVARLRALATPTRPRRAVDVAAVVSETDASAPIAAPGTSPHSEAIRDDRVATPRRAQPNVARLGIALAVTAAMAMLTAAASRRRVDAVAIELETDARDTVLGAVRESILRSASQILESDQRFVTVVADSTGAGCVLRFYTPRCRAAYVVTSRLVRIGDTVNALGTVRVRGPRAERRDLVLALRSRGELVALAADAAQAIAGAVAALSDRTVPELAAGATLPRHDAYVEYARGVEQLSKDGPEPATTSFRAAAARDSTFAAPRLAILVHGSPPERDSAALWIERHEATLSARDQAYAAALAARNRGDTWNWFLLASKFRSIAPDDPLALREFADAAFAKNYYAAADSALTTLQTLPGWQSQATDVLYEQIEARHDAGDFDGALQTWRTLSQRLPGAPYPCMTGVLQYAAMGREAAVDSLIHRCVLLRENLGDIRRLGRRITNEDEWYRRAGREYVWHGHTEAGQRALDKAYNLERQFYARDTSANNGWLAKELSRDWSTAYRLMLDDFGRKVIDGPPCARNDRRRGCIWNARLRFGVAAGHAGDTATALATLRWLDTPPHDDSLYKVDRAKVLLGLGRRAEAIRSLRDALDGVAPGTWMHANTELLELRGDPEFEALIAPRRR